jgi:hypothetical protein
MTPLATQDSFALPFSIQPLPGDPKGWFEI